MWKVLLGLLIGAAFVGLGIFVGKSYFGTQVTFITQVERMRDDVTVSHERDITTYYHVCPERDDAFGIPGVTNRPPELFILFPSTLKFSLSLKDLDITEAVGEYVVKLGIITADNPYTDTTKIVSIVTATKWGTAEERYEGREKSKVTDIAKYLTLSQLENDHSIIKERMEKEVFNLLTAILKTNENNIKPIRIEWDESKQKQYVQNAKENLSVQPPFGIKGCQPYNNEVVANIIIVNGIGQSLDDI